MPMKFLLQNDLRKQIYFLATHYLLPPLPLNFEKKFCENLRWTQIWVVRYSMYSSLTIFLAKMSQILRKIA